MKGRIDLDDKQLSFHLIGIFGIGMSGLAQYLKWLGFKVSGSDRALDMPENRGIYNKLINTGINLYKQDGSFADKEKTDYLVYSTAIEEGNSDFASAINLPRLHRTELLVELFRNMPDKVSIAVAGTCGKTSVSSLIGETFERLGLDPFVIVGGFVNSFANQKRLGNFKYGEGKWMIFETDESDKSLLSFSPDYSILLNVGTDHYPKEELIKVFQNFLKNTKKGAIIERNLYNQLDPESFKHLKLIVFTGEENINDESIWSYKNYKITKNRISVDFLKKGNSRRFIMPLPGRYNAENFLAAFALFELLKLSETISEKRVLNAMSKFEGVHRRFEYSGKTSKGAQVYCDFAHNADKIESALNCAKELTDGSVYAIFQPHGYKPFRFMKDELFSVVDRSLQKQDKFILLPVFYSGGTCIPNPKSENVTVEFAEKSSESEKFLFYSDREELEKYLEGSPQKNDIILIMGARDNSLPIWAQQITKK